MSEKRYGSILEIRRDFFPSSVCFRCKGDGRIEWHDEYDEELGTSVTCPRCDGSGLEPVDDLRVIW